MRRRQGTSGGSNRAWTQRQCHEATQIHRSAFSNTNRATVSSTDSHLEVSVGLNVFAELSASSRASQHADHMRSGFVPRICTAEARQPARSPVEIGRVRRATSRQGERARPRCVPAICFEEVDPLNDGLGVFLLADSFFLSNCQLVKFCTAESRTFQNF